MASQPHRVDPFRPACPSCKPIRAWVCLWTKSTTRFHASRCVSFNMEVQPGVRLAYGETQVIAVIAMDAPAIAREARWTRRQSLGTPPSAMLVVIGGQITQFLSIY